MSSARSSFFCLISAACCLALVVGAPCDGISATRISLSVNLPISFWSLLIVVSSLRMPLTGFTPVPGIMLERLSLQHERTVCTCTACLVLLLLALLADDFHVDVGFIFNHSCLPYRYQNKDMLSAAMILGGVRYGLHEKRQTQLCRL